jgi:uncharacterized protein YjbJ (UPF0337 family)
MEKQIIAEQVSALSADQALTAKDAGFQFARNQLSNLETAKSYASMIGTNPSFDQWEAGRINWVSGYVEANPDNTGNSADKAWNRFSGLLDELYGLVKPKAASAAAEKKRIEREKKTAEILEKHNDLTPTMIRAQMEAAYQTLAKNPTNKEAAKQVKELDKVLKVKQSAENKEHGEELKTLRGAVKIEAGKCTDIDLLQTVLDMLVDAIPESEL